MSKIILCFLSFLALSFSSFHRTSASRSFTLTAPDANDKLIVLKSLDEVALTPPKEATNNSAKFEPKQTITPSQAQKSHSARWQNGYIIRWNELIRELIAAYNVPPRCFPDSSGYPTPKRERASDLPRYPFANPPYASRVFAYTSVAQHDALLAAHFYQAKYGKNYPLDEAVVAAVTADVLIYLFPGEVNLINQKMEEAIHSALMTNNQINNSIISSTTLGKGIAQKIITLAQNDGMDAAQDRNAEWEKVITQRASIGEITWRSIQKPIRAPIEPLFGSVKTWWGQDIFQFKPAPPPSTKSDELKKEIAIIKLYANMHSKENAAIEVKWADPEFSHTPIGHWNLIACDLFVKNKIDDMQQVRILALLNRALMDAAILCWDAKMTYCYPRPSQIDRTIHTHLPLPNFPSYPSGHSTFSGVGATILGHFFPTDSKNLFDMAEEASLSRVYSALHFKMDCDAGMTMGKKVGNFAIESLGAK